MLGVLKLSPQRSVPPVATTYWAIGLPNQRREFGPERTQNNDRDPAFRDGRTPHRRHPFRGPSWRLSAGHQQLEAPGPEGPGGFNTTLFAPAVAPGEELAELYRDRWTIVMSSLVVSTRL